MRYYCQCGAHFLSRAYLKEHIGICNPHWPRSSPQDDWETLMDRSLPTLLGEVQWEWGLNCVYISHADENFVPPIITWWDETFAKEHALDLPADQGVADYEGWW